MQQRVAAADKAAIEATILGNSRREAVKYYAIGAAILSLILGIAAAVFWFRSTAGAPNADALASYIAAEDGSLSPMNRYQAQASANNRTAAILTGFAVLAGSISSVLGVL